MSWPVNTVSPNELRQRHMELQLELETLIGVKTRWNSSKPRVTQLSQHYHTAATQLSEKRRQSARFLRKRLNNNSSIWVYHHSLKLPVNHWMLRLPAALMTLKSLISMNPGQPLRPLQKVASGGELSRISLCIQVVTAATTQTPTLVFDEVDVGIGGPTAEVVGRMLHAVEAHPDIVPHSFWLRWPLRLTIICM